MGAASIDISCRYFGFYMLELGHIFLCRRRRKSPNQGKPDSFLQQELSVRQALPIQLPWGLCMRDKEGARNE